MGGASSVLKIIARIASGAGAAYLGLIGLMRFWESTSDGLFYILAVYFIIFAAMIIIAIIPIPFVTKFVSFLDGNIGLGFFMIFIALLIFDWNRGIEFANSIYFLIVAVANIALGCAA